MGKKDKSNKTKELSKTEKKAAKAAKKAAKKEMNTSPPPAIHAGLLVGAGITSAQAKNILEKTARLPTTPDGTYTIVTNAGNVTIVKSTMSNGNARLTWLFNGEKSDKSKVYNALKVVTPLVGPMDNADTSEDGAGKNELTTFSKKDLKTEYTKKGLIKAMAKTGVAKKEFIKAIKKRIEGKKILGQDFVAIMDDEYGDEFSSVDINRVFDEINLK